LRSENKDLKKQIQKLKEKEKHSSWVLFSCLRQICNVFEHIIFWKEWI
jgi:hypothetical protein